MPPHPHLVIFSRILQPRGNRFPRVFDRFGEVVHPLIGSCHSTERPRLFFATKIRIRPRDLQRFDPQLQCPFVVALFDICEGQETESLGV